MPRKRRAKSSKNEAVFEKWVAPGIWKRGSHSYRWRFRTPQGEKDLGGTEASLESAMQARLDAIKAYRHARKTGSNPHLKGTFGELLERYRDNVVKIHHKSPKSTLAKIGLLLRDYPDFCKLMVTDITRPDVIALRDSLFYSEGKIIRKPSTVNKYIAIVSGVFSSASEDWGYEIEKHPTSKRTWLEENNRRERRVSPEEWDAFLRGAKIIGDRRDRPLVEICVLLVQLGVRAGELLDLRWHQVDLSKKIIRLKDGTTKNNEGRIVGMSSIAERQFIELKKSVVHIGGRIFYQYPERTKEDDRGVRWLSDDRDDARKIGAKDVPSLADLRTHDLRHESLSRLGDHMTTSNLMKVSGHKTRSQADRYIHADEMAAAAAQRAAQDAYADELERLSREIEAGSEGDASS